MKNELLSARMTRQGASAAGLARDVRVSPKAVDNWVNKGVTPRRETQIAVAKKLQCEIRDLWPNQVQAATPAMMEIANVWSHRSDSPKDFWWQFFESATEYIDLLGYAIQFLHEEHKDFVDLLKDKAAAGCSIRIILADPRSQMANDRDVEEGLNGGLIARIGTSLTYLRPLIGTPNVELRLQTIPMYNSIFRFDDNMLVTPHLHTKPGRLAPLFHFRRKVDDGIFDTYAGSFDEVFSDSKPAKVAYA